MYVLFLLFFIIGYVIGIFHILYKYKEIYGIIVIDDENESYFFKMPSDEIKDIKKKYVRFKIEHK